jgi:hypothetical protein
MRLALDFLQINPDTPSLEFRRKGTKGSRGDRYEQ